MIGRSISDLDTPALCLDLDLLESNIARVAATLREYGVQWRPHIKGHKIPAIAHKQLDAGAIGVTCAKLGEAEVMAAAGIKDLLIANIIVGPRKLARLAALTRHADPIVCIDHIDQARALSDAMTTAQTKVRVLMEIDVGLHRVGVAPGGSGVDLACQVAVLPGVELAGVMGYEGHLLALPDLEQKEHRIRNALGILVTTHDLIRDSGVDCPIVSCGGTGSYQISVRCPGITELQCGGAVYMDAFYAEACNVVGLDHAMTVQTTIVSRPAPQRAIIDAGRKTLNIEVHTPRVAGRDDVSVVRLSAEHGELNLEGDAKQLRIGDRLALIPGYGDLTTVLHDVMYGIRNGKVEVVWPIAARGKLQ